MTKKPYMPFFPDAYMTDTVHLTMEEQGAYFRLLCWMWTNDGKLQNDDRLIPKILSIHPNKWQKLKPSVVGYFIPCGPYHYTQKRLQKEYDRANKSGRLSRQNTYGVQPGNILKTYWRGACIEDINSSLEQPSPDDDSFNAQPAHPNPSPIPNIKDKDKIEAVESCGQLLQPLLPPERAIAFVNELFGYFSYHQLAEPSDFSVVVEWIGKGADPWLDILPVVHGVLAEIARKKYRPPQSWKYFGKTVFASLRKRHY